MKIQKNDSKIAKQWMAEIEKNFQEIEIVKKKLKENLRAKNFNEWNEKLNSNELSKADDQTRKKHWTQVQVIWQDRIRSEKMQSEVKKWKRK